METTKEQLDPQQQLVLDLLKYMTATEGERLPAECGAPPR
jgi:hypothetical protein